jgi:hypothetical protein
MYKIEGQGEGDLYFNTLIFTISMYRHFSIGSESIGKLKNIDFVMTGESERLSNIYGID